MKNYCYRDLVVAAGVAVGLGWVALSWAVAVLVSDSRFERFEILVPAYCPGGGS